MDLNKIGKFISEERKKKNYTQKQLADILNVSDRTVSKWECGDSLSYRYYTTTHAYNMLENNMDEENKLALAIFALSDMDDANLHFRDDDG